MVGLPVAIPSQVTANPHAAGSGGSRTQHRSTRSIHDRTAAAIRESAARSVERDIDLIADLSARREVWISLTVETDMDRVPGLPLHTGPPGCLLSTRADFRVRGIAAISARRDVHPGE